MSAIAGLFVRSGGPVDRADLDRMVAALAHRGPDGLGAWVDGPLGLGHCALWTTRESCRESLPLVRAGRTLAITADARLDNRSEIIARLGLASRTPDAIGDAEIILAAYERWGDASPTMLLGDFAFAIWDTRRRRLFCARDQTGVKPFFFFASDQLFAFATEIKALLALPAVPRQPNDAQLADFLVGDFSDGNATFYHDVWRLPPAHALVVTPGDLRASPYWSLNPSWELRLESDAAYAAAFRELFFEAVRCRLRSAFPVGALLSGGLDSSAIVCTARQLSRTDDVGQLTTFSAVFDAVPECDERRYQDAVLAPGGLRARALDADRLSPLADLEAMLRAQEEPLYGPGIALTRALLRLASEHGIRVILDGHGGDETVSHGFGYLDELARAGRWHRLGLAAWGAARVYGESPWGVLSTSLRPRLEPAAERVRRGGPARAATRALRWLVRQAAPAPGPAAVVQLAPEFARRTGRPASGTARPHRPADAPRDERLRHHADLTHGLQAFALEVLDRAAGGFAIEPRYPFRDRRLLEFCLALPPEQKLHGRWTRFILRRALDGILPSRVQWRPDKTNFLPNLCRGLLLFERERLDDLILGSSPSIADYVDLAALRLTYQRFLTLGARTPAQEVIALWRVVAVALWLQTLRSSERARPAPVLVATP